jgi:hypothetical protein
LCDFAFHDEAPGRIRAARNCWFVCHRRGGTEALRCAGGEHIQLSENLLAMGHAMFEQRASECLSDWRRRNFVSERSIQTALNAQQLLPSLHEVVALQ